MGSNSSCFGVKKEPAKSDPLQGQQYNGVGINIPSGQYGKALMNPETNSDNGINLPSTLKSKSVSNGSSKSL